MRLPKGVGLPLVGVDLALRADVRVGLAGNGGDRRRMLTLAFSKRIQFPGTACSGNVKY